MLSRKKDEQIVIGDSIVVTIVEVRGDKVRIGIEAPKDVIVHRQEVYDAIRKEAENGSRLHSADDNGGDGCGSCSDSC